MKRIDLNLLLKTGGTQKVKGSPLKETLKGRKLAAYKEDKLTWVIVDIKTGVALLYHIGTKEAAIESFNLYFKSSKRVKQAIERLNKYPEIGQLKLF